MLGFRAALLNSALTSFNEGGMSRADLIRLRFATLNPKILKQLQDCCEEQALADKRITSVQGVNWEGLADFLKEIIPLLMPLILKLLGL
jgi:hypothetical protein